MILLANQPLGDLEHQPTSSPPSKAWEDLLCQRPGLPCQGEHQVMDLPSLSIVRGVRLSGM
jgi:hypothetical protein